MVFVTPNDESEIILTESQDRQGMEIEELIVTSLSEHHSKFMSENV